MHFPVADRIAATFGPCCEAAIHDFHSPETSVVHVAGQVTGRKVGQSFDHLIKNVLLSKDFQNDQSNNYVFQTPTGRTIKSSSVLLRDGGHVIGMLCINYDLTIGQSFYQQMAAFYGGTQEDAANGEVDAADDVTSIIDGLIDSILRGDGRRTDEPEEVRRAGAVHGREGHLPREGRDRQGRGAARRFEGDDLQLPRRGQGPEISGAMSEKWTQSGTKRRYRFV